MKIKKFQAPNFREALARVKKEMGDEAVILSSEEINGLRPKVEVVAAIDHDLEQEDSANRALIKSALEAEPEAQRVADKLSLSSSASLSKNQKGSGSCRDDQIWQELINLRESLEEWKKKGYEVSLTGTKKSMYQYLKNQFIRDDLALQLTEKAEHLGDIPALIRDELRIGWDLSDRKVIVLIGSTGVGKTTTAAKLCGQAIKRNKKVGFISLDTFRIGAIEQIRVYSRILGVPLFIAASPEEIRLGINKLNDRDLVLIDTTGRNPKDPSYIDELKKIYGLGIPMETHLLLSGSSSEYFMNESFSNYRNLPVDCLAFTKMDEASGFGSLYNFSVLAQKPIAYLTNGQKVPNDIAFYNKVQLADLIFNNHNPNIDNQANPAH